MNRLYQICLFFALSVAGGSVASAQSNVVLNGAFEDNCGSNTYYMCGGIAEGCAPGWSISHGSPELRTDGGIVGPSSVVMANYDSIGGGMYTTLSGATPTDESFQLSFYYRVVPGTGGSGNVVARFTTGLTPRTWTNCYDDIPTPETELVAYDAEAVAGDWQQVVVPVSSAEPFTQLNIYPVAATYSRDLLWIEVDGIEVRHCGSSLLLTPDTTLWDGYYQADGNITVTSGNSPGMMELERSISTEFTAGKYILLEAGFLADLKPDQYFSAYITPCGLAEPNPELEDYTGPTLKHVESHADGEVLSFRVTIAPNPTTGTFTIRAEEPMRDVVLTDLFGKAVMQVPVPLDATEVMVDISHLASGLYLVQGETKTGQKFLQKLVKG